MGYKKIDIKNYLIVYLLIITIAFSTILFLKLRNREKLEQMEVQEINTSKQNKLY